MASFHEALSVAETYSPAEEQFNRRRRTVGTLLAPVAFLGLWLWPLLLVAARGRAGAASPGQGDAGRGGS